jgi:hypothetical protein
MVPCLAVAVECRARALWLNENYNYTRTMQLRHNKPDFDADITYYIIQKNEKKNMYNTYV